ncbi:MAG TPA: hypothetical protein VK903_01060 [Propionicimonas sp.]|nr:hypothetical protein [Propionicimonas sp.]
MTLARRLAALVTMLALTVTGFAVPQAATAVPTTLTNLGHLDFLLDEVRPGAVGGHSTYRLESEPTLVMPWTYADARKGGQFARVGGGSLDPATGHYTQGAFNVDDIARAAVVYLRHWRQTGARDSRTKAYELLRSVAYLQTDSGANRGRSVLWMQSDGTLNPSAEPVELPDPSDSGPSYWQARSLWAFGEGYAAFKRADPAFAAFLQDRIRLSVAALARDVLSDYRRYDVADGRRVPAWLIVDGADATAEAVLGLAAYTTHAPGDTAARRALRQFADGIAVLAAGTRQQWPYQAILPWAQSRSLWHAWASQTGAALARAADALDRRSLAAPAVAEALSFDPTLLTGDGADNGWLPTPVETVQIAYGVDSRVQSLVAVADTTGTEVAGMLAALHASWFFGANRSGEAMYSPATGVTFDGLEADGRINRNSGAESTIHGLLTMLALDAHPRLRSLATSLHGAPDRDGLRTVEAEDATRTTGSVQTPESGWTGESSWSGGSYLRLASGQQATIATGTGRPTVVEPVSWLPIHGTARSRWAQGDTTLGVLNHRVGEQGITAVPGALLPQRLPRLVTGTDPVTVTATRGTVDIDALLLRPALSTATFTGDRTVTLLFSVAGRQSYRAQGRTEVRSYDAKGRLASVRVVGAGAEIRVPAQGVVLLIRR